MFELMEPTGRDHALVFRLPNIGMHRRGRNGLSKGHAAEEVLLVHELQRGAMRMHILHHAARQEIHGAWMTEELSRHGYPISPGTLYPTLHRLEGEGLLTSVQRVIDGRTRRMYKVTQSGRTALAEDRKVLAELAREILGS